jgi:hypothetical protein
MYLQYQSIPADFAPQELKQPYDRVAPDPTKWPVLVAKIKDLGRDFTGYAVQDVTSITAPTLIMIGDRDIVRPEHAVEMFRMIQERGPGGLPVNVTMKKRHDLCDAVDEDQIEEERSTKVTFWSSGETMGGECRFTRGRTRALVEVRSQSRCLMARVYL